MSLHGELVEAFGDMPLTLKGITSFFAVFGLGSLVVAALPGVEHRMAGETLTPSEFWQEGYGRFAWAMGLWLAGLAFGLLRRARGAAVAAIGAYVPLVVGEALFAAEPRVAWQAACAVAWAAGLSAYLFRTRGARAYFSPRAA